MKKTILPTKTKTQDSTFIKVLRWTVFGTFLLALIAIGADSYRSPSTFEDTTTIAAELTVGLLVAVVVFSRNLFFPLFSPKTDALIKRILLPLCVILSVGLTIAEALTPPNYIYSKTLINVEKVGILGFGLLVVALIDNPTRFLQRHAKMLLFWSAPILFSFFLLVRLWPYDYFKEIVKEDHSVEWLQFFTLLSSALISLKVSYHALHQKMKVVACLFFLATLGFFFIAGDEISWGQRILKIETPSSMVQQNLQGETNLHNLESFHHYVGIGYVFICLYALFSQRLATKFFSKNKKMRTTAGLLIVPLWLSSYFIPPLVYNVLGFTTYVLYVQEWAEVTELFLYLGLFWTVFEVQRCVRGSRSDCALP